MRCYDTMMNNVNYHARARSSLIAKKDDVLRWIMQGLDGGWGVGG